MIAPATIRLPADDLCLAFANTRYWRGRAAPTEEWGGPADLLAWIDAHAGAPAPARAQLATDWQAAPAEAAVAFGAAMELREALYRLFAAHAEAAAPAAADIARLNRVLATHAPRQALLATPSGLAWAVPAADPQAVALAPVVWSAGDLLTGPRLARVRCCDNPECRYLFLDDSKAGSRRWCTMSTCGNRAKAHRHYARRRAGRVA